MSSVKNNNCCIVMKYKKYKANYEVFAPLTTYINTTVLVWNNTNLTLMEKTLLWEAKTMRAVNTNIASSITLMTEIT